MLLQHNDNISNYEDEVVTITFNKEMLKQFSGYDVENPEEYFKRHPRSKKPPFEKIWLKSRNGLIPSINTFLNCPSRQIQNSWEQHLKDYCAFCLKQQGIKHYYFDSCIIMILQFKPTKSKSDPGNLYAKPFIDSIVEYEVIRDDNYTIVRTHLEYIVVDKKCPRSEIRLYPVIKDVYDFDFVLDYVNNELKELEKKYKNKL